MKKLLLILLALACLASPSLQAAKKEKKSKAKTSQQQGQQFLFQSGDRVCFIGNSITHAGYWSPIMLYYVTRFPDAEMSFFNLGLGGDRVDGLLRRLQTDLLSHKPTVSVVMIGMNDMRPNIFNMKDGEAKTNDMNKMIQSYENNAVILYDSLKAHSRQLILLTPSIFDQTQVNDKAPNAVGKNDALRDLGEFMKKTAPKYDGIVVDAWKATQDVTLAMQAADPTVSVLNGDRVHPGPMGCQVMSYQFLKDTKAPAYVSSVDINAKKQKIEDLINCEVKDLKADVQGVSFSMKAASLPVAVIGKYADALKYVPFTDDFNKEIVRVRGLEEGNYKLSIGGTEVGTYSAKELEEGVNLSTNDKTPQYRQAVTIANLVEKYRKNYQDFRQIVHGEFFRFDPKFTQFDNLEACLAEANRVLAMRSDKNDRISLAIKRYISYKPNEAKMRDAVFNTAKEIYTKNKPAEYVYTLVKQ